MDGYNELIGGERGIRTLVRVTPKQHFQCCAFDRSATSPKNYPLPCLLEAEL
jgi:hypothetical protein